MYHQSLSERGLHMPQMRLVPSWGTWSAEVTSRVPEVLPPTERIAPLSWSQAESRRRSDRSGSQRGGATSSQDPQREDSSRGFQQVHHHHQSWSELQSDSSLNAENRQKLNVCVFPIKSELAEILVCIDIQITSAQLLKTLFLTLSTGSMAKSQTSFSHCCRPCLEDRSGLAPWDPSSTFSRVKIKFFTWTEQTDELSGKLKTTCSEFCAGVKNQMNCNCCVVRVLIQSLTQHTHVLFQVAPQEIENIVRSGMDHVTKSLQHKNSLVLNGVSFETLVMCEVRRWVRSHSLIFHGALKHGEVR